MKKLEKCQHFDFLRWNFAYIFGGLNCVIFRVGQKENVEMEGWDGGLPSGR